MKLVANKSKGASVPTRIAITAAFATLGYGGLKVAEASNSAKQPLRLAGQAMGYGFFLYGYYYASAIGLVTALELISPERTP